MFARSYLLAGPVLLIGSTVLGSAPAQAADDVAADAADGGEVATITVSARRREENAQDVPIPIASVSGDALEKAGRFRLEDLNETLPSTNVQFNNPRQTSIAVRGLGNNPANDALESSVGVYLDDVYLGRASMANLDLIDVDQIALLRGPQGTLFGKNTTAGVLNISTRLPGRQAEHWLEASYGDFNYYQLRGTWAQPLGDELGGRVSFARTQRGGFVKDLTTGRDLNGTNRGGGRAQLLWKPNSDLSIRLIGDYSEEHSDTGAGVLYNPGPNGGARYYAAVAAAGARVIYNPDYDETTINGRQHMDVRQGGGSGEVKWRFNDFELTSITAYRSWSFVPYNDGDGTNLNAIPAAGQNVDDNQWTQEIRLASPSDRPWSYVTGLYYFNQHQNNLLHTQYGSDATAISSLRLGIPAFANGYTQTTQLLSTKSWSVFGQVTWKPADAWELAFGLRDTKENKSVLLDRTSTGSAVFVANPSFAEYHSPELTRDDNNISGLFSASYKLTSNVLGYASLSRGAKSGGINPNAPVPGFPLASLFVRPEVAKDAELGVKSTLFANRLVLNANLFWTDVSDYQATLLEQPTSGVGAFQQIITNVGKVRTRGVEADITSEPVDGLSLSLSASLNDARYVTYHDAPCSAEKLASAGLAPGQLVCDLSGQPVVGAPKWIVNPSATYTHPLFAGLSGTARVTYSWRSWFFGSADDSQFARVPAYGLLDLRYTLQGGESSTPWSVSVWSNNTFDKRYVLGGLLISSPLYNYSETPGLPRTVGVTVNVRF